MKTSLIGSIEELGAHLVGVDLDEDGAEDLLEEALYEAFSIDLFEFEKLVKALLPLCVSGYTGLSGRPFAGFGDGINIIFGRVFDLEPLDAPAASSDGGAG